MLVDFDIIFEAWMQSNFTTSSSGEEYNNEYKLKTGHEDVFSGGQWKESKTEVNITPSSKRI